MMERATRCHGRRIAVCGEERGKDAVKVVFLLCLFLTRGFMELTLKKFQRKERREAESKKGVGGGFIVACGTKIHACVSCGRL
jgi:hypothetical protein